MDTSPLDYELIEKLGKGSYGNVYRARLRGGDKDIALKISRYNKKLFEIEEAIVKKLKEINNFDYPDSIVKIYNISNHQYEGKMMTFTEMELVEGESLMKLYQSKRGPIKVYPENAKLYLIVLFDALRYLHKYQIYHRDIKPDNIIYHNGKIKLIDFNLSCTNDLSSPIRCGKPVGSILYSDPRIWIDEKPNYEKGDIYSLAFTFITLISGYDMNGSYKSVDEVRSTILNNFDMVDMPHILRSVLVRSILDDPDLRPIAEYSYYDLVMND